MTEALAHSRQAALFERITAGQTRNVDFTQFCRLVEAFGFERRRVSGRHHIYRHPEAPRPLSLQPRDGEAKPYQIAQFLQIVEEQGLKLEPEQ